MASCSIYIIFVHNFDTFRVHRKSFVAGRNAHFLVEAFLTRQLNFCDLGYFWLFNMVMILATFVWLTWIRW